MFPTSFATTVAKSGSSRSSFRLVPDANAATASCPADDWLVQWNGPVVATATAVSALVLSEQHGGVLGDISEPNDVDCAYQGDLSELLVSSMHWLARRQREDGGWSSLPDGPSQLATSMIVQATFQLTGAPAAYPYLSDRMARCVRQCGGVHRLKALYGPLHSATLLVRGCYALAEVVTWKQLPTIPLETAPLSDRPSRVEFWAGRDAELPALVALGIASSQLHKPINPLTAWRRARACRRAMEWLERQQADDGGFCDSVAVTSVVLMSLASVHQGASSLVRRGVEYLFGRVQADGSWPGTMPPALAASRPAACESRR